MTRTATRIQTFRKLHESGCFVIPNPWDVGSAKLLEQLGFPALATTSSGFAWSLGLPDTKTSIKQALEHFRLIAEAVAVPVNGDFEGGFATEPEGVQANVTEAVSTGIAGLSIEDSTGNPDQPLYDFSLALERIQAAREAIEKSGTGVLLTARTEGFITGRPDIEETIRRLTAFAKAGADCLYAPGLRTKEEIKRVVAAVAPKPVNVLVGSELDTVEKLAAVGVRRISVGGALARTAWTAFLNAAKDLANSGSFSQMTGAVSYGEMNQRFS
ncbi:MAG: isocitrate lyase/PEP mutase family protein [Verrucomicrobiae bacterium]|nr:isocitrate lyase/PEP mutase family protein [Verrucomicrobiae bacterium]